MVDRRRDQKTHGLRWAAAFAVATAGAVTFLGRARKKPTPSVTVRSSGRGTPSHAPSAASLMHGYETDDTNIRKLAMIMIGSIGIMIAGVATVFFMYTSFAKHDQAASGLLTRQQSAIIIPPEPHLQADPYRDIGAALMAQRQELTSYGWFDADHKRAHIPIDRGIALMIGQPFDSEATVLDPAPRANPAADAKPAEGSAP